jgi:ribosomal protein S18 acetylase RimI-like enzyme
MKENCMQHELTIYDKNHKPSPEKEQELVNFLFTALEEYGDPKNQIQQCFNYALERIESFGGSIISCEIKGKVVGAVALNRTGMKGYIPENILVYIAVDKSVRGKGLGRILMQKATEITDGSIKLHVEKENPAMALYKKVGYKAKYVEMRLQR